MDKETIKQIYLNLYNQRTKKEQKIICDFFQSFAVHVIVFQLLTIEINKLMKKKPKRATASAIRKKTYKRKK